MKINTALTDMNLRCNRDTIIIDEKYNNDEKLYIYIFNEKSALIGGDGFIKPNYEIEGSLNKINEITIPASTFVVISNQVL